MIVHWFYIYEHYPDLPYLEKKAMNHRFMLMTAPVGFLIHILIIEISRAIERRRKTLGKTDEKNG